MQFCRLVGHKDAKLALILNLIDPGIGGVLLVGDKGTGKSSLARALTRLLPNRMPYVEVPLNVTEDAIMGSVDLEEAVRTGRHAFQSGLLARAQGGVLYIDDINLLSIDIVNLVLNNRTPGNLVPGDTSAPGWAEPGFTLIASMNPEEGPISPKLIDNFGLCAFFSTPLDSDIKLRVLKHSMENTNVEGRFSLFDSKLKRRISRARELLGRVVMPPELSAFAVEACLASGVEGHRGDIALERASLAYAAFRGSTAVTRRHIEKILPLALVHRRREAAPHQEEPREQEPLDQEKKDHREQADSSKGETSERSSNDGPVDATPRHQPRDGRSKEEIFQIGKPFDVKRLLFKRDRIARRTSGRRTNTRFSGKSGRYVKSVLQSKARDIAVDATLRAAAPWQLARGRTSNVIVRDEDLRFKRREKKMGHLVIFVVDCSGSMGAKKRMIETKGAVLSLLIDCYHKRDKVSLIAFRKDRAEILLPPTTSVDLVSKKLKDVSVGGKTPLPAALFAAYNLIRQVRLKGPDTRFVVAIISDGRANQGISGISVREEITRSAEMLREMRNTDYIVVDTEDKSNFMRMDLALHLADELQADYFTTDDLKAEYLAGLVSSRKL